MAKTLVKGSSSSKLAKLRQKCDWITAELNSLEDFSNEKKQAALNALLEKLNKKLDGAAFKACDKQEYAQAALEAKLQSFDVKQYMSYRAVNHGLSKSIFAALKKGEGYGEALKAQEEKIAALKQKRAEYVKTLEAQKAAFLQKNGSSDDGEYKTLKAQLEAQYLAEEKLIEQKYANELAAKRAKLQSKLNAAQKQIEQYSASASKSLKLDDGVLLSVKGLKMYFGGLKAVDDLTFDVKKGEIFGLIGPNGAGKTTVFNCITRFYDATAGEMYFENKQGEVIDLRDFKVHDVILQGISRTFQNVELVKEVSVMENLLVACTREYRTGIFLQALGYPTLKKEEKLLRAKAMRILTFMGIESYAGWIAMGLPYGILKKVEIARALMSDSKLIIMDEPAAGLNDSETAELTQLIRRIRDEFGVTILLVEHDMSLVMNVCDTVCAISFGKMLAIGTCDYIKQNKDVQEAYLGVDEDEPATSAAADKEGEGNE